jgi:hypothetical protein
MFVIGFSLFLVIASLSLTASATTLTVAAVQGSQEVWSSILEEFESQHPGVNVQVNWFPGDELINRIMASHAAGQFLADVFMVYHEWLSDLADAGTLTDLSSYKDTFIEAGITPVQLDGITLGLPFQSSETWSVCISPMTESETEAIDLLLVAAGEAGTKLSPDLAYLLVDPYQRVTEFPEEIQTQLYETDTVPVAIWLNAPLPERIQEACNDLKRAVDENWSLEEVRAYREDIFIAKSDWYCQVEEEVVSFFEERGFWDEDNTSYSCLAAPVLYTDLPADERWIFDELQSLDVVDTIYLAGVFEAKLDSAVPTIEAPDVWGRRDRAGGVYIDGKGVKIAIVESGRVNLGLPAFNSAFGEHVTRNATLPIDTHKTAVAEVAASSEGTYNGVAPESSLLSADSRTHSELILAAAISWALREGADVLNASIGENIPAGGPTSLSRLLDFIVFEHMRAFTAPAGNEGRAAFVCSPASGYNVIAVGGIDDKDTVGWADVQTVSIRLSPRVVEINLTCVR